MTLAIIGGGSWGTALAAHLARLGTPTRLWARDATMARSMAAARENPRYLPGVRLPDLVEITSDRDEALAGAGLIVVAVPSHFLRGVLTPMAPGTSSRTAPSRRTSNSQPTWTMV